MALAARGQTRSRGPLAAWGVRVYIGESFGPIFLTNTMQYGVLTVELPRPTIDRIADWARANPGVEMMVDLESQLVQIPRVGAHSLPDRSQKAQQAVERCGRHGRNQSTPAGGQGEESGGRESASLGLSVSWRWLLRRTLPEETLEEL